MKKSYQQHNYCWKFAVLLCSLFLAGCYQHIDKSGIVTPVRLRIVKDGEVKLDKIINAHGIEWGRVFYLNNKPINTRVRNVLLTTLRPGHYILEIETINDLPELQGIDSYIEFTSIAEKYTEISL